MKGNGIILQFGELFCSGNNHLLFLKSVIATIPGPFEICVASRATELLDLSKSCCDKGNKNLKVMLT